MQIKIVVMKNLMLMIVCYWMVVILHLLLVVKKLLDKYIGPYKIIRSNF